MFDTRHYLKDAGLVAADAAGQVDGSDKVVTLGDGLVEGFMIVDVSAIEIASNDELYKSKLQGSSRQDFAHNIEDLAILELGAKEVLGGDQDSAIGRYVVPFLNVKGSFVWPYVRVYTDVNGAIATGINFKAWLEPVTKTTMNYTVLAATTTTTTTT